VLLVAIGVGLLAVAVPGATGLLFDLVIPGSHLNLLLQLGAGLVLAALVMGAFEVVREIALLRLGARFQAALEPAIMDRLLDLPGRFFRDFTAGDLTGRALAVSAIRDALTGPALSALLASMFSGFSLLVLFWYAPRLALVASVLLVPLAIVLVVSSARLIHQQRLMADLVGQLSSLVLQLLNGVSKLRVAGAEARAFAQWAETFSAQRRAAYATRSIVNRQAIFTASFPVLAMLAVFAVVATSPEGPPSVGAFVAFTTAYAQFVAGALALLQASSTLVQVLPSYERARPIFDAAPELDDSRDDPGELSGAIDLDHVTFRYDPQGPPILDDVSLQCRPGEFIALVGPSGSGKSTLLRLLLGFEQAESGAIFYDGRDLATLDLRLVRRQIGSVLQNGRLLPGDIVSNIVGSSQLTLDDAWEAARLAGLADEIEKMPMGMHTVIGEGSDTLSGGQRQRLTIARAIVHRPRIVFFDEATSALDNRTQEIVSASLNGLAATRVVIAHRLSTVVNADRIYVLQQGRIVESGTYRELMQRRGVFAELARRQIA
jgi:ATP-binding cassette subfamily C protein